MYLDSPHSVCQGGKTVFAKHSARAPRLLRGTGCGLGSAAPKGCTRTPGAARGWMLPGRDCGSRCFPGSWAGRWPGHPGKPLGWQRWMAGERAVGRGMEYGNLQGKLCRRHGKEKRKIYRGQGGTNPRGTAAALLKRQGQRRAEHVSA